MDIINDTIQEWRDLGFHYDRNDDSREWTIIGSIDGLTRFSNIPRQFASNPRNDVPFEHDHFGPYMYLKIMNVLDERGIDSHAIFAPRLEFSQLADLVDAKLSTASPGDAINLRNDFSPNSKYELALVVKNDDFDPGLYDEWVKQKLSEQSVPPKSAPRSHL